MSRSRFLIPAGAVALGIIAVACGGIGTSDALFNSSGSGGVSSSSRATQASSGDGSTSGGGMAATTSSTMSSSVAASVAASSVAASTAAVTVAASSVAASSSSGQPGIDCVGQACTKTQICCFFQQGMSAQAQCSNPQQCGGAPVACAGPADCPGQICCGSRDQNGYTDVSCQNNCDPMFQVTFCGGNANVCQNLGLQCKASQLLPGFQVCGN